ncbi:MAG TPA: hypothetical protein VHB23_12490 [Devosiaceae bacterium]|nr:hypothetical protein [Devosiaceae bacterium]
MRRVAVFIAVLASLTSGSAMAEPGRLTGMGANLFGNSFFHFGQPNLERFMVSSIQVGRLRVQLQRTRLEDIQRVYGGTIYQEGAGNGAARWLCYQGPQASTWFMSNMLGGGEFVMMVATQAGAAGGSCDAANVPPPQMGIPGLGATTAQLKATFGSAVVGSHSDVSYRVDRPAKDGLGTANDAQYIGYVVRGGSVVGYGVGETTAQ